MLTDTELYYLVSIKRQLRQIVANTDQMSLGWVDLVNNLDWLECFIEKHKR